MKTTITFLLLFAWTSLIAAPSANFDMLTVQNRIGVRTNSPKEILHVKGNALVETNVCANGRFIGNASGVTNLAWAGITNNPITNIVNVIISTNSAITNIARITIWNASSNSSPLPLWKTNTTGTPLELFTLGNVGIGTNNPTTKLHVADNLGNVELRVEDITAGASAKLALKTGTRFMNFLADAGGINSLTFNAGSRFDYVDSVFNNYLTLRSVTTNMEIGVFTSITNVISADDTGVEMLLPGIDDGLALKAYCPNGIGISSVSANNCLYLDSQGTGIRFFETSGSGSTVIDFSTTDFPVEWRMNYALGAGGYDQQEITFSSVTFNEDVLTLSTNGTVTINRHLNATDADSTNNIAFPYAQYSCNADQIVTSTTITNIVVWTDVDIASDITPTADPGTWSKTYIQHAGTYLITVSAITDLNGACGSPPCVMNLWLAVNGVIGTGGSIPRSNTRVSVPDQNSEHTLAVSFIYKFAVNDYFELWFSGNDTDLRFRATAAGGTPTMPSSPSVIMTVNKVSD